MRGTWTYPIALVVLAVLGHRAHRALDQTELPESPSVEETLASTDATRLLSLGHYALAADYFWLKSLGHFGDASMHQHLYPNLEPFLTRANTLDPYFASVYKLAGTALTLNGMDVSLSNRILERGLEFRPDVWEIPFYLGFNAYYFENDFARASELFAIAADIPGSPDYSASLATRLAAEGGRPEIGLAAVNGMLEKLPEDDEESQALREEYEERRDLLLLEVQLHALNRAVDAHTQRAGRPPASLEEMVEGGILKYIPEEPLGGTYSLRDGRVVTSNEGRRLRIAEAARKTLKRGGKR